MAICLPEFEYFTVFLKNKNVILKIRRSKVTDYAALTIFNVFSQFMVLHFIILERSLKRRRCMYLFMYAVLI